MRQKSDGTEGTIGSMAACLAKVRALKWNSNKILTKAKSTTTPIQRPAIDGSNPGWLSRDRLRFKPSMARLMVPKLIHQATWIQTSCWIFTCNYCHQLELLAIIIVFFSEAVLVHSLDQIPAPVWRRGSNNKSLEDSITHRLTKGSLCRLSLLYTKTGTGSQSMWREVERFQNS